MKELECLIKTVQELSMKTKRIIYHMMRTGADPDDLICELGVSLQQYCMAVVLADRPIER